MATHENIEHPFPSTRWEWRKVKMKPPPAGHNAAGAKRPRFSGLSVWPRTRTLRLTIRWRGGAASWWLVESRGTRQAFPGHLALEDVMTVILSEQRGYDHAGK
jgi:hypothetical protein